MRIVVPIDETPASEAALPEAVRLVAADGGEIVLVSVGELPETSEMRADAEAALRSRLAAIRDRLAPIPVETRVQLAGDPVRGILEVAREVNADRIVMATEEDGRWESLVQDEDVAEEVRAESPVPVYVATVRHPGH